MDLLVVGERTRPDGPKVRVPLPMRRRAIPRTARHLLEWWPKTSYEMTLDSLGFFRREWNEVTDCYICEGAGRVQGDHPHHLYHWARVKGAKCERCGGKGKVIRLLEERNMFPCSFIRRTQLLFRDVDDVLHLTTKKGKVRRTRCSQFKELPADLLTAYGRASCMTCLAWRG